MPRRVAVNSKQKALILEKAGALFWDRGYDNTSIRHISRACGFESSNIYYYFRNKEQILFELIWQEINQLVEGIKHLESENNLAPSERLKALVKIHVDLTLTNRHASLRMVPDTEIKRLSPRHKASVIRARDTYDRVIRKILRAGIDSGEFIQMDEKITGFAIAAVIVRSRIWFSPDGKYSVDEITDFIFSFITRGLLKPEKPKETIKTRRTKK